MKKRFPLFFAMLLAGFTVFSQDIQLSPTVIASAGNYSESDNISLSWTVGELAVTTLEAGDFILTQGFQQSYDDGVIGFEYDPIRWQINAYPNPVQNDLMIQFDLFETREFLIEVQDVTGRILSQEQYKEVFPGDVRQIDMSGYKSGIYFFRISTPDMEQVRVLSIRKK